jgi:hypothetical protein
MAIERQGTAESACNTEEEEGMDHKDLSPQL